MMADCWPRFITLPFISHPSFTPTTGATAEDKAKLTVSFVDVDVDSNNNEGFELSTTADDKYEGEIEQADGQPGKYVGVNDDDSNADGVADYLQGFGTSGPAVTAIAGEAFTPIQVGFANPFNLLQAVVRLTYSDSDPLAIVNGQVPADGNLRLWLDDGDAARDGRSAAAGGDYIPSGDYAPADLAAGQTLSLSSPR